MDNQNKNNSVIKGTNFGGTKCGGLFLSSTTLFDEEEEEWVCKNGIDFNRNIPIIDDEKEIYKTKSVLNS